MAESKHSPAENLPWMPLATVAASLLAGGWLFFQPLTSSRPNMVEGVAEAQMSIQDVDARLWQDPLEASEAEQHEPVSLYDRKIHWIELVREKLAKAANPLILAVMVNGSGYAEKIERRLRDRVAVENALERAGYSPEDAEHVGSFTIPWSRYPEKLCNLESWPEPSFSTSAKPVSKSWRRDGRWDKAWSAAEDTTWLTVPFEFHEPDAVDPDKPHLYNSILVLWLRQEFFEDSPLSRLAELFSWFQQNDAKVRGTIRILGPNDSDSLLQIIEEVEQARLTRALSNPDKEKRVAWEQVVQILNGASMFAFRPSAADRILCRDDGIQPGAVAQAIKDGCPGLKFYRTTAADDTLVEELERELLRRQINPRLDVQIERECMPVLGCLCKTVPGQHVIAIISEQDTLFARALPATFNLSLRNSRRPPLNVELLSYLRGIDGRTPLRHDHTEPDSSHRSPSSRTGTEVNKSPKPRGASEVPEGTDQSDYIRRLAKHVGELDAFYREQSSNRRGIEAVGVLGSDVYDKLEILHALRSHIRARVFFTIGLDARFYHPAELSATRNLVVISPFGLSLDSYYQQSVPPFRDSNQTAAFAAALCALDIMHPDNIDFNGHARVFEIGKYGPIDLSNDSKRDRAKAKTELVQDTEPAQDIHPARPDLYNWWEREGHIDLRGLMYRLLGALLLVGSISASGYVTWSNANSVRRNLKPGHKKRHLSIFVTSTTAAILLFVPVVILILAPLYYVQRLEGEPFNLLAGASMWPTEAIRLFATLLAIHFVLKSLSLLKRNETEITPHFGLEQVKPAQLSGWDWLFWRPKASESRPKIKELWAEYCARSSWPSRIMWTLIYSAMYLVIAFCMMQVSRQAISPVRGNLIGLLDRWFFFPGAVISCTILTFFVVHATLLDTRFTYLLSQGKTDWPDDVLKMHQPDSSPRGQLPGFTREYLDILLIAERTRAVTRLIYYPLIIISLLILCRLPIFDAFDWPPVLVASSAFYVGVSCGCVFILRRVAEHARKAALSRLEGQLRTARAEGPKLRRKAIAEMVEEVEKIDVGIFAPITRQPVIGALLLPSATAAISALLQNQR